MAATRFFQYVCATSPGLSPFVSSFSSALITAHKMKIRLKFLRRCLEEQVLPKSLLNNRLLNLSDHPFEEFHRIILEKHIVITKIEVRESFKISKSRRSAFDCAIPSEWKHQLLDHCYGKLRTVCDSLSKKLDRKLCFLIKDSEWTKNARENFVVNLSSKPLNSDAKCALGYGLSFAASQQEVNSVSVARAFCNLEKVSNVPSDEINICKGLVYGAMSKTTLPTCPKRFFTAYNSLKSDSELHITKADKSNCVVILNKEDYISKMNDLLSDTSTYSKLSKNPLESLNSNFNKKIKQILKGHDELIKKLTSLSPSLPYMYGLIKTHKPDNPVRPITSSVSSANYKLSKWLVTVLNPIVGTISACSIKNNVDLVDQLNNMKIDFDFSMVSFDVKSLFTRVPVNDLLGFLDDELKKHSLPLPAPTIIELIKLCILDSKFTFNNEFYSQIFGMAMGNPLSPVLSNIYMEFFEKQFLPHILPPNAIWLRYVDDVFCVWPNGYNIDDFLDNLNSLVPSIKFTYESEQSMCLPFLDVLVHRCGRSFKFDVYRKPTNVLSYVHFYSSHHKRTKLAVLSSMFLRALRICSPEYINGELDKIYNIALDLKYPKYLIDTALGKAKETKYNVNKREFCRKNLLVLPYHETFTGLPNMLKKFNINVCFSNKNTVKNVLIKNSPQCNEGCVYTIPCKHCNKYYIGQTGKSLELRKKQHMYSIRAGQDSNALFVHVRDNNHVINWNNSKEIKTSKSLVDRNIIESSLIKQTFNENLNISEGLYKLDKYITHKISSHFTVP